MGSLPVRTMCGFFENSHSLPLPHLLKRKRSRSCEVNISKDQLGRLFPAGSIGTLVNNDFKNVSRGNDVLPLLCVKTP